MQSLADFVDDAIPELLRYASQLEVAPCQSDCTSEAVGDAESLRLQQLAAQRTRYRLQFFNSKDGLKLR